MMGACAIGMIALLFLKETAGCSIRGTEIPPSKENDFHELQEMPAESKA